MKIHFIGFEWESAPSLPTTKLLDALDELHTKATDFEKHERLLFTQRLGSHFAGILLTVKGETRYSLLDQKKLTVEVKDLAANQRFFEFNAFIVNPTTNKGLYAYSHRSMTVSQFFRFCSRPFEDVRRAARKAAEATGKYTAGQLNANYGQVFLPGVIIRQGKLETLIDRLSAVNRFEFRLAPTDENEPWLGVYRSVAKAVTHVVSFEPKVGRDTRVEAVKDVLRRLDPTRAVVRGKNMDGFDDAIQLTNNPDPFGVWDTGKGPPKTAVITDNVGGSLVIRRLLAIAAEHPDLFGKPS